MKKILIQDQQTKCFLDDRGKWTLDADDARNFPTSLNAIVHCVQKEINQVQLVVRNDESPAGDFVVPVGNEHYQTARDFASGYYRER